MSNRTNVTDREQDQLEEATFDGASPYFDDKSAASPIGARKGNGGGAERNVGGVVVPASDKVGSFPSDTVGRA